MIEKEPLMILQRRTNVVQPVTQRGHARETVEHFLYQTHLRGSRRTRAISLAKRA